MDIAGDAGASRRVGGSGAAGINSDTLRGWVKQAQVDAGQRPGTATADGQLEHDNAELRQANDQAVFKQRRELRARKDWLAPRSRRTTAA